MTYRAVKSVRHKRNAGADPEQVRVGPLRDSSSNLMSSMQEMSEDFYSCVSSVFITEDLMSFPKVESVLDQSSQMSLVTSVSMTKWLGTSLNS